MRKWKGPQIPRSLLHSMYEVHTEGGGYDKEQGGQWKPGTTVETVFQGVVMPLNNEDLQYIDSGSSMLRKSIRMGTPCRWAPSSGMGLTARSIRSSRS
jgi:hypothetical protein